MTLPSTDLATGAQSFFDAHRAPLLIIATVAVIGVVTWILVRLSHRVMRGIAAGAQAGLERSEAGSAAHRNKQQLLRRTRTMSRLVTSVIVWAQCMLAIAVILGILGVNVTSIIASAGLVAAMLTFSAQTLLKDLITGLSLIGGDQIDVGDVVDVGFGLGVVEAVGLRATQVRAFDGMLWCVRNGEIARTANRSRGWVRLILEIDFSPATDVDAARDVVLRALTDSLARCAAPHEVRATPTCWGMSGFSTYGFRLKFLAEYAASAFDRVDAALREAAYRGVATAPGVELADAPLLVREASHPLI